MRKETQIFWFRSHFLNRKKTIIIEFSSRPHGICCGVIKFNLAMPHEGELPCMLLKNRRKQLFEPLIIAVYLFLMCLACVHFISISPLLPFWLFDGAPPVAFASRTCRHATSRFTSLNLT